MLYALRFSTALVCSYTEVEMRACREALKQAITSQDQDKLRQVIARLEATGAS